jgi:flagellar biosynthesis protein FlhB
MADESPQGGERTEEATPKKRADAHRDGQIPKSTELTTAVMLLGSAALMAGVGPGLARGIGEIFASGLMMTGAGALDAASTALLLQSYGWKTMMVMLPMLLGGYAVAFSITAVQARGVLSAKPLGPNFGRMNPLSNGKRMLGAQPWMELFKSLMKMGIIGIAVYFALDRAWNDVLALAQTSPVGLLYVVRQYGAKMLATAGGAYLVVALSDYAYQLWQHEKQLRMSKEEIKQEYKQTEGDAMIKARRRAMGRSLARRQMFTEVPNADVVITNPTHIAIAIRYDIHSAPAPIVIAMGQRKVAERIKAIAKASGVPCVENKPVARALLKSATVGTMIPAELYLAVAEVLAFVMKSRETRGNWQGSAHA